MNSSEGFSSNIDIEDDDVTPLNDKLYREKMNERSCRTTSSATTSLHQHQLVDETKRWSVAKISVLILIVFSLADVIIHMVDAQMGSLEAHDHARPSMGLGSAAISSVTTTLSPILPFTGGIDLRREDYWTNGLFGSFYSVVEQVRDAYEESSSSFYFSYTLNDDDDEDNDNDPIRAILDTPRGGTAVSARKSNKPKSKKKSRSSSSSSKSDFILSSSDPFIPLKDIAELTLKDITMSFRYAVESTQRDYNSGKFLSGLLPRVKKMVDRISTATILARGKGVPAPITAERIGHPPVILSGDIDAVNFCAAMRIFAEWRVLRQVPPGYKGYAVGVGLGQKDIVQNIAKIEHAIHDYVNRHAKKDDSKESSNTSNNGTNPQHMVTSPTLRELLQYEVDTDVHDNTKLPCLKEKSAAMGLLWVRRQVLYQTAIFNNVIDVPTRFDSSRAAVQAAYDEVYGNLHGWAVQKIFSYSFQAAPNGIEIYKYMNPHRLEEVQQEARSKIMRIPGERKQKSDGPLKLGQLAVGNSPIARFSRHVGKEWDKVAGNVVNEWDKIAGNVVNEWDKVAGNVVNEWDKVTGNIVQLFGQQRKQQEHRPNKRRRLSTESGATIDSEQTIIDVDTLAARELEMETFVNQEMRKDAYEHIKAYLEVVDPLLDDLSNLIDEFNMDDPTKV